MPSAYYARTILSWTLGAETEFDSALDETVSSAMQDLLQWEREMEQISDGGPEVLAELAVWQHVSDLNEAHRRLLDGGEGGGHAVGILVDDMRGLRSQVAIVKELRLRGKSRLAMELRSAICNFATEIHRGQSLLVEALQANGGYKVLEELLAQIEIERIEGPEPFDSNAVLFILK